MSKINLGNLIGVIGLVLFCSVLFACPNPTVDNDNDNGNAQPLGSLRSVMNNEIRSLLVSNIPMGSTARNISRAVFAGTEINTLSYVTPMGDIFPVVFFTSCAREVILRIEAVSQVGDRMLIAKYSAIIIVETVENTEIVFIDEVISAGQTLINMETGILHDFSGFDMNQAIVHRGYLYAVRDSTIFKINLSNISSAIPLNNPQFNPVSSIYFIIGNRILGGGMWFDINGISIPRQYSYVPRYSEGLGNPWSEINLKDGFFLGMAGIYLDQNGDYWHYSFLLGFPNFVKFTFTLDDDCVIVISEYHIRPIGLSSAQPGGHFVWIGSGAISTPEGIAIIEKCSFGTGIDIKTILFNNIRPGAVRIDALGNYAYWYDNGSIYRIFLSPGSNVETLYSNSNMLSHMFTVSSKNIIFYKYLTATDIGTFTLSLANLAAPPVQVATSMVEIKSIIELTF